MRTQRTHVPHSHSSSAGLAASKRAARQRMPSTFGYMLAAGVTAGALFFALWWMLHGTGDEAPWFPAGLAASVVMLIAAAARQVVMRRAWTRYILEQDRRDLGAKATSQHKSSGRSSSGKSDLYSRKSDVYSSALRAVQKKSAEADAVGDAPEEHLEAYHLCKDYLLNTEEALRNGGLGAENRVTIRAGRERVRALQKHHLLAWAAISARTLTNDAQRRVLVSDKIETAQRALDVINAALKIYPEEPDLLDSTVAVEEFMASAKVAHWVELAERSAFKGQYRRAIDRYRDALFYVSRGTMTEVARRETTDRLNREIELLRARLKKTKLSNRKNSSSAGPTDASAGREEI